jgi:hypothetical protein
VLAQDGRRLTAIMKGGELVKRPPH